MVMSYETNGHECEVHPWPQIFPSHSVITIAGDMPIATKPAQSPDVQRHLNRDQWSYTRPEGTFWLKGALHKRAGHAIGCSIGQLKQFVGEDTHCRASL